MKAARPLALVALVSLGFATAVDGQQRVDFSGAWTSGAAGRGGAAGGGGGGGGRGGAALPAVDLGSGWGPVITLLQRGDTLIVERVFFTTNDLQPPLKLRYALDGSRTTNTLMMGRGMQESISTAAWQGERLVITTTSSVPSPQGGRPVTTQVTRTLALQPQPLPRPPSLVVETVWSAALGGQPTTTRTVYTQR